MSSKKKPAKPAKCRFRGRSFAEQEAGCPLDHCACNTHDAQCTEHQCPPQDEDGDFNPFDIRVES